MTIRRLLLSLALLLAPAVLFAQVDRATVTGSVKDASGAVVPSTHVTLTQDATGIARSLAITSDGQFLAVSLAPGAYRAEAEAEGFRKVSRSVVLEVGQKARLDFVLEIGQREETLVVEARRLLDTEQAALGTVVEQKSIATLPLAIRNWDDLLALVAGAQGDRYTEESGGTASGRTGGVNVHGSRSLQNNFLLDGVDNNTISTNVQELTTQVSRPSIDSIGEFKVVTSPYAAEYGRSPGAAISVSTKSGTNAFHGTLYDFYRNDRFDANNFFANRASRPKPTNDQNQFGGNIGGPLVRDKAFFFVDYEGTRITKGVIRQTRVPIADERRGVFGTPIKDPVTGLNFLNNTIPAERIDPVAAALVAMFPDPNAEGTNNFIRQPNVTDDSDRVLARVDFRMSERDNVFARYIYSSRARFIPGFFGGTLDGTSTSAWGDQDMKSHGLVGGWTRTFGSTVVNELRVSWTRAESDAVQEPFGANGPELIGMKGVPSDPRVDGGVVGGTIDGGYGRIGSPNFLPKFQRTTQAEVLDTISWMKGPHQIKAGFDILAPMNNQYLDVPATRGDLRFRGRFTGNAMADFLLGYVADAQISNVFVAEQRHWAASFFVQDDFRASERLTLNLGLRYDFITPALEAQNRQSNFDPATQTLVQARDGSLEERGLVTPDRNNVAPRLGWVFRANDKTVLRGGYGVFFNLFDRMGSEDQLALNPPGLVNNSLSTSSTTTPLFFLRDGFPANYLTDIDLRRIRIRAAEKDSPKTFFHQYSIGVQRALGRGFTASIDAVGTQGRNLANLRNLNQPAGGNGPLPYPNFGPIEWRSHSATSSYKGVDVTIERSFSRGYGLRVAYTLSESRDQTSEHLSSGGSNSFPQEGGNLEAWEGPSDFDTRHRVVGTFVAELPFGEGKSWATTGAGKAILGGWTISGIFTARTGRPFTVTQGSNNVGQLATGLPNRIGTGEGARTVEAWFDVKAFPAVPSGTFGDSGRNILRGPGWQTLDLSLQRRIRFTRNAGATARADVFNVLNRANFGLPDANIANATAGTITALAGDPRVMQFSLRLDF